MANTVYKIEEVLLEDGSSVTLKPSPIKVLRKGTALLPLLNEVDEDNDILRRLLDIVAVCLVKQRPDFIKEIELEDGSKKQVTNYDVMEDIFDIDTSFRVVELCLGVKLNDPNLIEATAAQVAAMTQMIESDSTNSTSQS